jgi:hypothetical protein
MPEHKQVTTCRKSGGPVSKFCSCEHCTLGVCSVCGAYEGSLTTDCPGVAVNFDKQKEVYETRLDYTDERGWHQGKTMNNRSPNFAPDSDDHAPRMVVTGQGEIVCCVGCSCGWQCPPDAQDSDAAFTLHAALARAVPDLTIASPKIDWPRIDRTLELKDALAKKAIAWVLADRVADQHSADLTRADDAAHAYLGTREGMPPDDEARRLLAASEHAKIGFQLADQRAVQCDEELRQAARQLVVELEDD